MKDLKNLVSPYNLNKAVSSHANQRQANDKVVTKEAIEFVNRVMKTILANSPAWSMSLKGSTSIDDYRQQLIKAFLENNITQMPQVELGLRRVRKEPTNFLPSVGQFISWCAPTPETLGCASVDMAYQEACNYRYSAKQGFSHPCVAYALAHIGSFELSSKAEKETRPVFEKLYLEAINLFYLGDSLQEYQERFYQKVDHQAFKLSDLRDDKEYQQRQMELGKQHLKGIKEKLKKHSPSSN
jgi:hypothetical protein